MTRRQLIATTTALAALPAPALAQPIRPRPNPGPEDAIAARRFDATRRFMSLPQGEIAWVEQGSGPAALFLHGFPLSGFQFRGALERLSPLRRCLAPDLMGLGFTRPAPGQDLRPAAQADMIAAFLDRLDVREVDVVANDSGGTIAQLLIARRPGLVRSLLLANTDAEIDSPPAVLIPIFELARAGSYPDAWLVPWVNDKTLARSADGLGGLCYSDPLQPTDAAIDQYLAPLVASPERKALTNAYALSLEPRPMVGLEPTLRAYAGPVRVLWGDADNTFRPETPVYLEALFPNSRGLRRLPGAKLFWPEEYPDILADEAKALWGVA